MNRAERIKFYREQYGWIRGAGKIWKRGPRALPESFSDDEAWAWIAEKEKR